MGVDIALNQPDLLAHFIASRLPELAAALE
jgi:hypothetical protein